MEQSYETKIIVSQLTEILDFIDNHTEHINVNVQMIAYLSLALVNRSNITLLPYLHTIKRYKTNIEKCCEILKELYYVMFKIKFIAI